MKLPKLAILLLGLPMMVGCITSQTKPTDTIEELESIETKDTLQINNNLTAPSVKDYRSEDDLIKELTNFLFETSNYQREFYSADSSNQLFILLGNEKHEILYETEHARMVNERYLHNVRTKGFIIVLDIEGTVLQSRLSELEYLCSQPDCEMKLMKHKTGFIIASTSNKTFLFLLDNCSDRKRYNKLLEILKNDKMIEKLAKVTCGLTYKELK